MKMRVNPTTIEQSRQADPSLAFSSSEASPSSAAAAAAAAAWAAARPGGSGGRGRITSVRHEQILSRIWKTGHKMGPITKGIPMTARMDTTLNCSSSSERTVQKTSRSFERT